MVMAIGLSEEHEALRDSVSGWAERNVPAEVVRAAMAAETEQRPEFWAGLADQGLLGLHLPEEFGGSGYGLLESAVAIEALGERVAPGPYVPTVLASAVVLASTGKARTELLPGLADGSLTGAVALSGTLSGERDADGALVVSGTIAPVLGATLADVLVLPVQTAEGEEWIALDAASVTVTAQPSLDLTRGVGQVTVTALAVPAERILDGVESPAVLDLAAIVLGAEAVGLAAWCVRAAADYAKVREQFGRPIGQFQGIKHKISRMLVALEQARATVWDATRAEGAELGYAAAIAGVMAPDAAVQCAKDAVQTFGGIGYTYEHDAHLYFRRALTLRALLGSSAEWSASVTAMALGGVGRVLEVELPAGAEELRTSLRAEIAAIAELADLEQRRALADGGFVMSHLPKPWGRDAPPLEQVLIQQELRAAKVRLPSMIIGAWVVPSVATYGSKEMQDRFLPKTLSGEIFWCQLFSEPGAGSDLANVQMKAERGEGGWRLNGQKIWTSLAQHAQGGVGIARTSSEGATHHGTTLFLVDMLGPGVTVRPLTEMTGENMFNEVFLDDVFVPDDLVVGEVGEGWKVARNTLSNERVSLSSGSGGNGSLAEDLLGTVGRLGRELSPAEEQAVAGVLCESHSINAL